MKCTVINLKITMTQDVGLSLWCCFPKVDLWSDIDSFCRLSYNVKTLIYKLDSILQRHVVPLSAKNQQRCESNTVRGGMCQESAVWQFWHNKLLHNHFPIIPSLLSKMQLISIGETKKLTISYSSKTRISKPHIGKSWNLWPWWVTREFNLH